MVCLVFVPRACSTREIYIIEVILKRPKSIIHDYKSGGNLV